MNRRPILPLALLALGLGLAGCRAHFLCDDGCEEPDLASRGPETASVVIEEYSEFQCPFCRRVQTTLRELDRRYAGKLRFVYRHFPLPFHEHADLAARAGVAALRQDKFWPFHDQLFDQGRLAPDDLVATAMKLGLDVAQFRADLEDPGVAAVVARDIGRGRDVGVSGVPHFRVNGRPLVGAQPVEAFVALIDEELAKADALLAAGTAPEDVARELTEQNTHPVPAAPEPEE